MYVINAKYFQQALKSKGYQSIGQFAKILGIHRNTIHYYLSGHGVFPEKFEKMIQSLDLNPSDILIRKEGAKQSVLEPIAPIIDSFHANFPELTFILFGSRSRGCYHRYSDWDIGVFSRTGLDVKKYRDILFLKDDLEEDFPCFIDVVNLNSADESFLKEISKSWIFLTGSRQDWIELLRRTAKGV